MHRLLLCLMTATALLPCGQIRSRPVELARLAQHRRQWDRRTFAAYTFDLNEGRGRVMGGPFRVTVEGRRAVRVSYLEFGEASDEGSGFPSIDAVLDSARTALEYGHAVRICYDPRLGYPVWFASAEVGQAWSTVFFMTISKLHPLQEREADPRPVPRPPARRR